MRTTIKLAIGFAAAGGLASAPSAHADADRCVTSGTWNQKQLCLHVRSRELDVTRVSVDGSARGFGGAQQEGGHNLIYKLQVVRKGSNQEVMTFQSRWFSYTTQSSSTVDRVFCSAHQSFGQTFPYNRYGVTWQPPHLCTTYQPGYALRLAFNTGSGTLYTTPIAIETQAK